MPVHTCEWQLRANLLNELDYNRVFQITRALNSGLAWEKYCQSPDSVQKELCYAYCGNRVSFFRQSSSNWHPSILYDIIIEIRRKGTVRPAVLLATVVNKDSLFDMIWVHHPETLRGHKPQWTFWKIDSNPCARWTLDRQNTQTDHYANIPNNSPLLVLIQHY